MKGKGNLSFWAPRVLAILFIAFLTLFSFDVFEPRLSTGEIIVAFMMHNIPSIIVALILIVAWRHDLIGAITFFVVGIAFIVMLLLNSAELGEVWIMVLIRSIPISGFAFLVALLFLMNWRKETH